MDKYYISQTTLLNVEESNIVFVQGLSNIPAIAEYFENDNYEEDVNEDNPMGMKGEIARAFGQLIKAGFPDSILFE